MLPCYVVTSSTITSAHAVHERGHPAIYNERGGSKRASYCLAPISLKSQPTGLLNRNTSHPFSPNQYKHYQNKIVPYYCLLFCAYDLQHEEKDNSNALS
jgi:hypothetical protein